MMYVGLDVHKEWTTVAALDPDTGEFAEFARVANRREAFAEVLGKLGGLFHGVLESGRNGWAMYDELTPLFARLVVADPGESRRRARGRGAKTDRLDARKLALLLAEGRVPELWVPDRETRDRRVLTRGSARLSQAMSRAINVIRSIGASFGQECPVTSLHCPCAKVWLKELALPPRARRMLDRWVQVLELLEKLRAEAQAELEAEAREYEEARRLKAMPGVGPFIALTVAAEIGDVRRFRDAKALSGYAGLGPQVHESGGKGHSGPLPQTGNRYLRYAIVLAAQQMHHQRNDSVFRRYYWRMVFRHGPNPAKIATARKMLQVADRLLRYQETYEERLPPAA
jgi:transposase